MTANVPTRETGTSIMGRIMAFQSWRKNSTTRATSRTAITSVSEHLVDGLLDERRGVVEDFVFEARGETAFQLLHPLLDGVGHVERVGAGQQKDGHARGRLAVSRVGHGRSSGRPARPGRRRAT